MVFAAAELTGLTDFIDVVPGIWYEKSVAELNQKKIMQGYDDKTYRPTKNVNRAELAETLSKTLSFISHPTGVERWKKYINKEFSFIVNYPSGWKSIKIAPHAVGFRPLWMSKNSVQWAVIAKDNEFNALENLIAEMGSGYADSRAETRHQIKLNGKDATHVIVTTTEKPTWRYEQIFVPHFNKLYVVTNGAIENKDFELFWRSLKFLAPTLPPSPDQLKN